MCKFIIIYTSVNKLMFPSHLYFDWDFDDYWGCRGLDHMVVGLTTTYAINAYHH
jgi:hypothetical protein